MIVVGYILLIEFIISLALIYVCFPTAGIDHMPIYYEWEYIKQEPSAAIKYAAFMLMICTMPINVYFFVFKWLFKFGKYVKIEILTWIKNKRG